MSRPRPSDDLMKRLRDGKQELHRRARALPLPEKVRRVIELQRLTLPLLAKQRPLRHHERVWGEASETSPRNTGPRRS